MLLSTFEFILEKIGEKLAVLMDMKWYLQISSFYWVYGILLQIHIGIN